MAYRYSYLAGDTLSALCTEDRSAIAAHQPDGGWPALAVNWRKRAAAEAFTVLRLD